MSDQPSERARKLCWWLTGPHGQTENHFYGCTWCAAIQAALDEEREEVRRQVEVEGIVAHCVNLEGAEPPRHDCWCVVCNAVRKERDACGAGVTGERSDEERLQGIGRWVGGAGHLSVDDIAWLLERVRALEAELREDRETRQALVLDEEAASLRAERDRLRAALEGAIEATERDLASPFTDNMDRVVLNARIQHWRAALQGGERS